MNLNLSGNTQSNINSTQVVTTSATNAIASTGAQGSSANLQALSFAVGQVFSGEVAEISGKEILILLANNQTITAKMDGDISLMLGQSVYFEVKSNNNQQVYLRPLYTNLMSADPAVIKALDAANLPVNEKTVAMTSTMMEEGMPINKNALQSMFRQLNVNQEIDPKMLVQMTKLELPITSSNIEQFTNYKNFEHQIGKDLKILMEGLPEVTSVLSEQGSPEKAVAFGKELLYLLASQNESNATNLPEESIISPNTIDAMADQDKESVLNQFRSGTSSENLLKELPIEVKERLAEKLESLGMTQDSKTQMMSGQMTSHQLIDIVKQLFAKSDVSQNESLLELMKNDGFQSVIKDELQQLWFLKPAEVSQNGKVDELYQRLSAQTQKLVQIMQDAGKVDTTLMKSAVNMQDNVSFMNQLNQVLTYVQLPLKMHQENAHGELYVYTNKKDLMNSKDGNVSALLHLDMENLGEMDIYVAMQKNKVNTHFYLQKEEVMDLIEDNLHVLNERLNKKGYQMSTVVSKKESNVKKNNVEEFLHGKGEETVPSSNVLKYSFDVRA